MVETLQYDQKKVNGLVEEAMSSRIYQPKHYKKWTMEPFTYIMLNNIPFAEGCVIKYVMRWRDKNGIEDLKKAKRVLEMMIEMEEHKAQYTPEKGCL